MPIEFSLAWKYFASGRRHPFIGLISSVAVAGVAVGVAALIIVIAVMSGFERDLVDRVIGTYAHASVEGDIPFEPTAELLSQIQNSSSDILGVAPVIHTQAMLQTNRGSRGVLIRASSQAAEEAVSNLMTYMDVGNFPEAGRNEVLLGSVLARTLGVGLGDTVEFFTAQKRKAVFYTVSGIYTSGMYDYDSNLVYIALDIGQAILETPNRVSHINIKYTNPHMALSKQLQLQQLLGYPFYVRTWRDMNRTLFDALRLEKTVMFIILTLIVMVACFNIIGTLALFVIDKTREIGVLRALGADSGMISRIFAIIGICTGFWGTLFGVLIGSGVCWVLKTYPIIQIPSDIYYFDQLPVDWRIGDCVLIASCAMGLALFSALYPAKLAAKLKPAEALRYE